jgi:acyl carrier protein
VTRAEVEKSVREVMQTVLGRRLAAGTDLRRAEEPAWDSLKHVELIFTIEEALQLQFDAEELGELDSLGKLVASATKRLGASS